MAANKRAQNERYGVHLLLQDDGPRAAALLHVLVHIRHLQHAKKRVKLQQALGFNVQKL
jgi:hypothetical protein